MKITFCNTILILIVSITIGCDCKPTSQGKSFSFIMMGDTRTELFISSGADSSAIEKAVIKRYGKDHKLFINKNGKLDSIQKFKDNDLEESLIYNQEELPTEIFRMVDNKRRRVFCKEGINWVYNTIANDISTKKSDFVIHGGDMILFGYPDSTFTGNPYWQYFNTKFYSKLPKETFFPIVGNHETWEDNTVTGMQQAFPYLKDFGFSEEERIYTRDYKNSRFISLNCGPYVPVTAWESTKPDYKTQMKYLKGQLDDAIKKGIKNVFVAYHFPSFVQVGHPPLPPGQNPHFLLQLYADELNIVVFNSHTHTTEHYLVDNIHYLVIGAGGAPQKYLPVEGGSTEKELYWEGKRRHEEYNYLKVEVDGEKITGKIRRFTPETRKEPEWVEAFVIN